MLVRTRLSRRKAERCWPAYLSLLSSVKEAHEAMIHKGGLVAASKPIRSALRFVDGRPEVLEASLEDDRWRLRVVCNGREARATCVSKWQRVENAFQLFDLGTAWDASRAGRERSIRA